MAGDLEIEWENLSSVQAATLEHEHAKILRQTLASNLFRALHPARDEVRAGLLSIRHSGLTQTMGEPLRATVARSVDVEQTFPHGSGGARLFIRTTPNTRRFKHAARALTARRGWRHKLFGHAPLIHQFGKPGLWTNAIESRHEHFHKVVEETMVEFVRLLRAQINIRHHSGGGE